MGLLFGCQSCKRWIDGQQTAPERRRELQDVCKASLAVCPDDVFAVLRLPDSICQETNAISLFAQVSCGSLAVEGPKDAWAACLDPEYGLSRRMQRKRCRVYSFGCVHQPHKPIGGKMSSALHLQINRIKYMVTKKPLWLQ